MVLKNQKPQGGVFVAQASLPLLTHPHPQLHIGAVILSTCPSCPSVNTDIALALSYFLHVHRQQLLLCLFQESHSNPFCCVPNQQAAVELAE